MMDVARDDAPAVSAGPAPEQTSAGDREYA
jgi:hypothetical protein